MEKLHQLIQQYQELADFLRQFRQERHRFPELSNEEFETTAKIKSELEKHHITILDLPLKTGLVAEIKGAKLGETVMLRSDIDALPILEESGVPFSSEREGVMHACGHDFHLSAALGAAILLKQHENKLEGTVRILFQAAEETGLGALNVLKAGALKGVDAIFGLHNDPTLPVGTLGTKPHALTAGVDRFEVHIHAKGTHAARPQDGKDPIIVLAQVISSVQTIISRNVATHENAVVSITHVQSGNTWNVIPDSAYLEGTVRTFNTEIRTQIEQRFRILLAGIAAAFEVSIELEWHAGPPSVNNAEQWVPLTLEVAQAVGFEAKIVEASPIGEDFAFYQQEVPGVFVMVGSGSPYALHHPQFRVDDDVLFPTAYYLAELAIQFLNQFMMNTSKSTVAHH